jgi:hypothetical protein
METECNRNCFVLSRSVKEHKCFYMISSSYYLLWSKSTSLYDQEYPFFWWQRKTREKKEWEQQYANRKNNK